MADQVLIVSDIIVPEVFLKYTVENTATKSAFVQSGIVEVDREFVTLADNGGQTVNMPFWNDLTGTSDVLSDSGALETNKLTTSQDVAAIHNRGKAWATNDLSRILAGSDGLERIMDRVAAFWARDMQSTLIASLKGIFGAATMSGLLSDIHDAGGSPTTANMLTGDSFIDATQLLGDSKTDLAAIAMHSAVEAHLRKLDLIDFLPDSEGRPILRTFQGYPVIMDDGLTVEDIAGKNVYSTFVFGRGAVAFGVGLNDEPAEGGIGSWQLEFVRQAKAGISEMINRRRFIMHPRGIKWTEDTVAGFSPTNTELETASNWERVYEAKNIRMVKIRHNIA